MSNGAPVNEGGRRATASGWNSQIFRRHAVFPCVVFLTAPQRAGLIGQAKTSYILFALIRRVLRQIISFLAPSIDNLTCVIHRPMALAVVLLFGNRTRCRTCWLCIWFLLEKGSP